MYLLQINLLILSLCSLTVAIPTWYYQPNDIRGAPYTGASSIINMHYGNTSGLYMATQVYFESGNQAYFGIQPETGQKGGMILYSVFGENITSTHKYCKPGADTGPGISCHQPFEWVENRNYTLSTTFIGTWANGSTVWQGWCRDDVTQEKTDLGQYSVPKSYGLLSGQCSQFLEQFLHRSQVLEKPLVCTPEAGYSMWYPVFDKYGKSYTTNEYSYTPPGIFDYCEKQQGKPGTIVTAIPGQAGWNVESGTFTPLYPVD